MKIVKLINIVILISLLVFLICIFFIYQLLAPEAYYQLNKAKFTTITNKQEIKVNNELLIPVIGVEASLSDTIDGLNNGAWVEEFNKDNLSMLLAIHRFGWWGLNSYEKSKQTLYNVNKLKVGDLIYINWQGYSFKYVIKQISIKDSLAKLSKEELVIYTCEFFNSTKRVVLDASLIT